MRTKIILNITNEWGPENSVWKETYITAVSRLRNAGIKCLIMIDAPMCGQHATYLKDDALAVLDSDPQKNIVFSIHMYGYWKSTNRGASEVGKWGNGKPWLVETELQNFITLGIPAVVGEFSWRTTGSCSPVWL